MKSTRFALLFLFSLHSLLAAPVWAGGVSGTVTDTAGGVLQGIEVSAYRDVGGSWSIASYTHTDAVGSYSLDLPDGAYRVLFRDWAGDYAFEYFADAARIEDGSDVVVAGTSVAVDAVLEVAGRIAGQLTDPDGDPVENGFVAVYEERHPLGPVLFIDPLAPGTTAFDIGGLPNGDYIVRLSGTVDGVGDLEYFDDAIHPTEATPVEVEVGQTTSLTVVIGEVSGLDISGTITGPSGQILAGIEVWLFRRIDDQWSFRQYRTTGADGAYAFEDLDPAEYTLHFRDWSGQWAFEYWQDQTFLEHAETLELDDESLTADAQLQLAGRIAGTVSDPAGGPLSATLIAVFDEHGELLFVQQPAGTAYNVGGLPTGEYHVRVSGSQGNRQYLEFYHDAPTMESADRVEVIAGQTTTDIDAVLGLIPGGTVRGFVRDPYNRKLDYARVIAFEQVDGSWVEANRVSADYLDDDFDFALDLPPGTYRLRFEGGSWAAPDLGFASEVYDDVLDLAVGTDVVVSLGETVTGIVADVGDQSTGTLSGTVTDASGMPVAGVEVLPFDRKAGQLWSQTAITAADGTYTVEGLWPEAYRVRFYDPQARVASLFFGGSPGFPGAATVPVGDGVSSPDTVTGIDVQLPAPDPSTSLGSLAGTLTDTMGLPLGGVTVSALQSPCAIEHGHPECELIESTRTAADGSYRLRDLPAGDYLLGFRAEGFPLGVGVVTEYYQDAQDLMGATPVTVLASQATEGVDAVLERAGSIAGTVTDPFGNGFSLLAASAYRFEDGEWRVVAGDTELNGTDYRIGGLAAGTYRVAFLGGGYLPSQQQSEVYDDVETLDQGTDVVVTAGAVTADIDAVLGQGPPGAISGTVSDGDSPVAGIGVTVYEADGRIVRSATTGGDGTYTVDLLYGGLYLVGFEDPAGILPGEYYLDVAALDRATPVLVGSGEVTGIDAVLDGAGSTLGGGVIRGTVVSSVDGSPIQGVRVSCHSFVGDPGFSVPCFDTTAVDGTYEIGGNLPTGDYRVLFTTADGSWARETYDDRIFSGDATPVAVTVGAATEMIDAELDPGAAVAGTVSRENGSAYGLLYVSAYGFDAAQSTWRYVSGGFFLNTTDYYLDGLRPGTYRVAFRGSSLFGASHPDEEVYDNVAELADGTDVVLVGGQVTDGINAVLGDLPEQRLANAGFDVGIEGWAVSVGATSSVAFSDRDYSGDDASGSARIAHNGLESASALAQCSAVDPGVALEAGAWIEVTSGSTQDPRAALVVEAYAGELCQGEPLSPATVLDERIGDTAGWQRLNGTTDTPEGAGSVLISVVFDAGSVADFTAHVDEARLTLLTTLFADGFESGDLGAWSGPGVP